MLSGPAPPGPPGPLARRRPKGYARAGISISMAAEKVLVVVSVLEGKLSPDVSESTVVLSI